MRLLFINTLYASKVVGGAQRSVQFLAEAMQAAGHECAVICVDEANLGKSLVNGVTVYRLGLENFYWPFDLQTHPVWARLGWHIRDTRNPAMARRVGKILDEEKPDVVHTNTLACFSTSVWAQVQRRGIPVVHTLRDYYLACPQSAMFRHGRNCDQQCGVCKIFSLPRRSSSEKITAVVGNSDFMLKLHLQFGYFTESSIRRVVHNAYKPDRPVTPRSGASNPLRLGYLGRIDSTKGVDYTLEKLSGLKDVPCEIQIAGEGHPEFVAQLRERYESAAVRFVGVVKPQDFFSTIDVLIVPSLWHEPLPRTIFEAYAFGVPVIGSKRGGIPEILVDGETGLLFDPDEDDSLVNAVRRLASHPEMIPAMSTAALAASKEFLPENIVSSYQKIYQEALAA